MSDAPTQDLQLLLCDAGDRSPVLEEGLEVAALGDAKAPEQGPRGRDSYNLEALHRDPNDLEAQRWAVIAPEGASGDAALAAIEALIAHRRAQQGAPPIIHRVRAGMDAAESLRWKHDVLRDEALSLDERPRYLLILGDLDQVSLELQHVLANGSFVGRLHCPTTAGYRAYAEKVVEQERAPLTPQPRSLFFTAQDGTAAVNVGYRHLVGPCMEMQRDLAGRGKLDVEGPSEIPYSDWGPDDLLVMAGADTPSLLCSVSHGLGAPRRGWKTPSHQRALQGALAVSPDEPLTADTVREAPFLPGGVWFCVACYGAGTPPRSAYHSWLSLLADAGSVRRSEAQRVLQSLPSSSEAPFVAALPQALLANPKGPLAVIGHMDLAWTFGFTDPTSKHSRASRMLAAQRALLSGSRVGVGLDALMHAYRETNDDLMARYQMQRDALARGQTDPVSPRQLGELWMQRNDLRGYVLLGDPAARLAIVPGRPPAVTEQSELAATPVQAAAIELGSTAAQDESTPGHRDVATPPPIQHEQAPTSTSPVDTASTPSAEDANASPPRSDVAPAPSVESSSAPPPSIDVPSPSAERPSAPPPPLHGTPSTGLLAHHLGAHETPQSTGHNRPPPEEAVMSSPPQNDRSAPMPPEPSQPFQSAPGTTPQAPREHAHPTAPPPPIGAAPPGSIGRPQTLINPQIALRERAVLAMIRGDEAPRSIAARFGLPLEEVFYWLDVYREAGRRALGG